ncbi:hypothetical protein [Endozoicomonas sp. Mp262]|uniref:hypothetical protein n=1 Tax=Endozoicomonas sp. Mp262 TaxID=2919499 RepID=UPI0021DA4CD1
MKLLCLHSLALAVAVGTVSAGAMAANQGTVGPGSSQGDFEVSLNKQDNIVINNLDDMVLAGFIEDGSGDYLGAQNVCVGRAGTGDYRITASNSSGNFEMSAGGAVTTKIGYQVYFEDDLKGVASIGDGEELLNGVQYPDNFTTVLTDAECVPGTTNSTIWVRADGTDIGNADPGVYNDTVTVTVAVN